MNALRVTILGVTILLAAIVDSSTLNPNPATFQPNPEGISTEIDQPLVITEDMTGWNCRVMGNRVCGGVGENGERVLTLWLSPFISVSAE